MSKKEYPPCNLCAHRHKPLDWQKQYQIHGGDPDTSAKLKQVLDIVCNSSTGATSKEIENITGGVAVGSDIAAIRAWAINGNKPYCVAYAVPEGQTDRGCKIYRYNIFRHKAPSPVSVKMSPVQVEVLTDGQMAF